MYSFRTIFGTGICCRNGPRETGDWRVVPFRQRLHYRNSFERAAKYHGMDPAPGPSQRVRAFDLRKARVGLLQAVEPLFAERGGGRRTGGLRRRTFILLNS
jgi:hypothetical protein